MTRIKICGITRLQDLEAAMRYGADAVGLVVGFPTSPRNLSLEKAKELRGRAPPFLDVVLVADGRDQNTLIRLVEEIRPDAVQAYGLSDPSILRELGVGWIIKPINPSNFEEEDLDGFDAVLLDGSMGRGVTPNWDLCRRIGERFELPVILAGGLDPDNVQEAMRIVKPYGVDVSSGVERAPGIKDPEKIKIFIKKVREVDLNEV